MYGWELMCKWNGISVLKKLPLGAANECRWSKVSIRQCCIIHMTLRHLHLKFLLLVWGNACGHIPVTGPYIGSPPTSYGPIECHQKWLHWQHKPQTPTSDSWLAAAKQTIQSVSLDRDNSDFLSETTLHANQGLNWKKTLSKPCEVLKDSHSLLSLKLWMESLNLFEEKLGKRKLCGKT